MKTLPDSRARMKSSISAMVFAALSAAGPATVVAGDPVTDEIQRAYAPYRTALFRTNTHSQADSQQAVTLARQAWSQVVAKFAQNPAPPYDRDTEFAASLARVGAVYDKAAAEVEKGQLAQAHETLEEARDVIAAVRRRNQVIVFSDHMNAYHAEMEHLLHEAPKLLAATDGMLVLAGRVGALEYLAGRLSAEAPVDLTRNDEFASAVGAVRKSVADLKAAVLKQDANAAREAVGKVKGPYSRMFLKFG